MSDDAIRKLREQAAQERQQEEAHWQRQELLRRVEAECDNLRSYGERAGTAGSNRGLAEQIARFLATVRGVDWEDRLKAQQAGGNPAWTVALDIYRCCDDGDIEAATAKLDQADAIGPSGARARITDVLMRLIPDAIISPLSPSENVGTAGRAEASAALTDGESCEQLAEAVEKWKKVLYSHLPGQPLSLAELVELTNGIAAWRDMHAPQFDVTPLEEVRRILLRRAAGETTPEEELRTAGERATRVCHRIKDWLQRQGKDVLCKQGGTGAEAAGTSPMAQAAIGQREANEQRCKRGRRPRYNWQEDGRIVTDWIRAKGTGVQKKQFARDKKLTIRDLNRILNRHAKRNRARK
jgi:hypothetical protein